MTSRSVLPFCTAHQRLPILYKGLPLSLKIVALRMGPGSAANTWFIGVTGVLNPIVVFAALTIATDWQTYQAIPSVV